MIIHNTVKEGNFTFLSIQCESVKTSSNVRRDLCGIEMIQLFITHAPVYINDFRGVRARYVKRTG